MIHSYKVKLCECGCGKEIEFKRRNYNVRYIGGHNFRNKKFSEEHKRKIGISVSGDKNGMYGVTGKNNHISKENPNSILTRTRISIGITKALSNPIIRQKISLRVSGENHPNWQGGISNLPYPFEFDNVLKEQIKQRDKKCIICHKSIEELKKEKLRIDIHHIDYDKNNLSPQNLISLCSKCHGKTNNYPDYWKKYFYNLFTV